MILGFVRGEAEKKLFVFFFVVVVERALPPATDRPTGRGFFGN